MGFDLLGWYVSNFRGKLLTPIVVLSVLANTLAIASGSLVTFLVALLCCGSAILIEQKFILEDE